MQNQNPDERIRLLEVALSYYVLRYGLTECAKVALAKSALPETKALQHGNDASNVTNVWNKFDVPF